MNNYKVYNENEIKNKLKNFTENQDYKVFPAEESNQKIYTFQNEWLKSLFGGVNRVPVRVWQEKYDDQNFSYRGHFEKGKDYYYSAQSWTYGKDYQHKPGEWFPVEEWNHENNNGWIKGSIRGRNLKNNLEPLHLLPNHLSKNESWQLTELKAKHNSLVADLNSLIIRPESEFGVNGKEKKKDEITEIKKVIADIEREIEKEKDRPQGSWVEGEQDHYKPGIQQRGRMGRNEAGKWLTDKKEDDYSDLKKENQELKKQLSEVKKQLVEVLEELKKLRNSSTGQNNAELGQQIDCNEKLIRNIEEVPKPEIKEQVARSQALARELNAQVNATSRVENDNKSNSLPYLVGGSVLVGSALLIGCYLISKRKRSK